MVDRRDKKRIRGDVFSIERRKVNNGGRKREAFLGSFYLRKKLKKPYHIQKERD